MPGVIRQRIQLRCVGCECLYFATRRTQRFCTRYCGFTWRNHHLNGVTPHRLDGQDYADMVELRKQGWSYPAIGQQYGIGKRHAWDIVNRIGEEYIPTVARLCALCGVTFEAKASAMYCCKKHKDRAYQAEKRRWQNWEPSAEVKLSLRHAVNRRLEFNLTGVWPGERSCAVEGRYQSLLSLKQQIMQILSETPLTTSELHVKILAHDYEGLRKRLYELQRERKIMRQGDHKWVVVKNTAREDANAAL